MPPSFPIDAVSAESLVVTDLTKRYGQGRPVIDGLNHTFAPGTATGLVGPNGAGKTTLLRLLSTLAFPTSGRITYGELDIHAHPYRFLKHVGFVYASPDLPQHLTAVELLEWILRERGRWAEASPHRITALLEAVHLDERRDNLIGTYSSGMIQKTQVAAALVAGPAVLLMDEPFRGLDAESTAAVLGLLTSFKAAGGLLIVSSHARSLLDVLCDDVIEVGALSLKGSR